MWKLATVAVSLLAVAMARPACGAPLTPAQVCFDTKTRAMIGAVSGRLNCYRAALLDGTTAVDPACLAREEAQLRDAFAKAEEKGGCTDVGNVDPVATRIDEGTLEIAAALPPAATPGCSCVPAPATWAFTTGIGSGTCGSTQNTAGSTLLSLACNGLYMGGGSFSFPLPVVFPDTGTSIAKVNACTNTSLGLVAATSVDTGSIRNCTASGCLFGAPAPFPNPMSTATSVCFVYSLSQDLIGTTDCATGAANIDLPLTAEIFLNGDMLPGRVGIQPCPICDPGTLTCEGGPNNGLACTPGDSAALGAAFPTSHDCPNPPGTSIGNIFFTRIAINTGANTQTAVPSGSQLRVFCGYCRDFDSTLCFEGDPNLSCDPSPLPGVPHRCLSDADCAQPWESCEQRNPGAFGTFATNTITETGVPAGDLTDTLPHATTLASLFCVQPTFDAIIDGAADFPGPGALSLQGTVQILP